MGGSLRTPKGFKCANCGKPFRKGCSLEMISYSRFNGLVTGPKGERGIDHGPAIILFWHARCSKHFEGVAGRQRLVGHIEDQLRKLNQRAKAA